MSTTEYPQIADLNTVDPKEMTAEQREALVNCLSTYDSEQFIQNQGEKACSVISDIKKHQKQFDEKGECYAKSQLDAYMKKHPQQKIDMKTIDRFTNIAEKKSDFYRKKYACQMLGMGNNALNYCIGLQRNACLVANAHMGYDIMPDIGLSCVNARTTFNSQNIGQYHAKISDCYNPDTQQVKYDQNGKPKLRNGDLLLLIDPKDNQAYHCVRINVDENGKVSYTAGNGEAVSGKLDWMKNQACYVIPTQEITQNNARQHYADMSNEQLLATARAKGMFAEQTTATHTTEATSHAEEKNKETSDIFTTMSADFERFRNYTQHLLNPQNLGIIAETKAVDTPILQNKNFRFTKDQSQYG